jgi:hypothetical protein
LKIIQTRAEIGEDRVLQVKLPDDAPTGAVDVLVVVDVAERREPTFAAENRHTDSPASDFEMLRAAFAQLSAPRRRSTRAERRAAAQAGKGMLKDLPPFEEYAAERRAEEERHEKALGL